MLKNINPLLSGALLTTLDSMEPGEWLTLANTQHSGVSGKSSVYEMGETTAEAAAAAILSILPLDDAGDPPIAFLAGKPDEDDLPDVAFAVRGLATDAELRRVGMSTLPAEDFTELARSSTLTVQTDGGSPYAFLLRKGHA